MKKTTALALALILVFTISPVWAAVAFTPPPGSNERKEIMDAMRSFVKDSFDIEVVFVVNWLKVMNGWAWAETDPQSPDGLNRYEPFIALLQKDDGKWTVAEVPPLEEDSPPVDDRYFENLMEKHPGLPADVFPPAQENSDQQADDS